MSMTTICPCPRLIAWFQPSSPGSESSPPPYSPSEEGDADVQEKEALSPSSALKPALRTNPLRSNVTRSVSFTLPSQKDQENDLPEDEKIEKNKRMRLERDERAQREYVNRFLSQPIQYTKEDILLSVASKALSALEWIMPQDPKDD